MKQYDKIRTRKTNMKFKFKKEHIDNLNSIAKIIDDNISVNNKDVELFLEFLIKLKFKIEVLIEQVKRKASRLSTSHSIHDQKAIDPEELKGYFSRLGKKGGKQSVKKRFEGKSKEEISKIIIK